MVMAAGALAGTAGRFLGVSLIFSALDNLSGPLKSMGNNTRTLGLQLGLLALAGKGVSATLGEVRQHGMGAAAALGGVSAAVAGFQWIEFLLASRRARIQMAAFNLTTAESKLRIREMSEVLNRTATTSLLLNTQAVKNLAKEIDMNLLATTLKAAKEISDKMGVELPDVFNALMEASRGNFTEWNALMGTNVKSAEEFGESYRSVMEQTRMEGMLSVEETRTNIQRINDVLGPFFGNMSLLIGEITTKVTGAIATVLEFAVTVGKGINTAITRAGRSVIELVYIVGQTIGKLPGMGFLQIEMPAWMKEELGLGKEVTAGPRRPEQLAFELLKAQYPQALTAGPAALGVSAMPGWITINVDVGGNKVERYIVDLVTKEVYRTFKEK